MNIIKEITLTLFSLILIVFSAVYCVVLLGFVDADFIAEIHKGIIGNSNLKLVIFGICILIMILALISVFGGSSKKSSKKTGVLLENEKGKLLISKETLENLVNSVLKGFDNVRMNAVKTELSEDSKLNVNVSISVGEDVIIKDISNSIQNKVKETIKKSSDLEVKNVNISVRGIIDNKKVSDNIK